VINLPPSAGGEAGDEDVAAPGEPTEESAGAATFD
jgi:hypothetical protein